MGLGDKAKEVAIEHVKQKAARDILNGIKEWRTNKISTAKRRWIFELIQNAIDTAKARKKDKLKIEIDTDYNSFVKFKHNGGYFTLDEIGAVIYGGSRKPYEPESEYIGRFGTGFLVTHIVNRKVRIMGFAHEDGQIYEFGMDIDRRSNNEREISGNIEMCFQQLNNAKPITDISEFYTEFEYKIDDDLGKEAVQQALEELKRNIPFILTFNKIIDEIRINDQRFRRENEQKIDVRTLKILVNNRVIYVRNVDSAQIAVIIENNAIQSLEGCPKIFVGMPLTETADYINIPFVINSTLFDPTKERDALSHNENNKKLLEIAFNEYRILIEKIIEIEKNLTCLFNAVKINLISEEKTSQNPLWKHFNELIIEIFQEILEEVPLVETLEGRKVVSDVIFPINKFNAKELEEEIFNDFYTLLCEIKPNVPIKRDLRDWMQIAQLLKNIDDISECILLYDIQDLKRELVEFVKSIEEQEQRYPTFDEFAKNFNLGDGKEFLLPFFELVEKLYQKNLISSEFVDYLLPDQTGFISPLQWGEGQLSIDEGIPEGFKNIMHKIGWKIKQELVDKDFANFKIVRNYVRETLNTDKALKEALAKDEIKLKEDELKKEEWEDKILGWIELFWWCVENNKLQRDFPIITKEKTIRVLQLNDEEVLIPFRYMGFNGEYEDIYPPSRIMHIKYFYSENENTEHRIKLLNNYRSFITDLPRYKKELSINYNKLKSILTEEREISKTTHTIKAEECKISYLPFWNEIIGWVSEYQERGKLLFRFVISYLLDKDKNWEEEIQVKCSCREKEHRVVPSHWLASLKTDTWLPFKIIKEDEEKIEKRVASKEGIENLFSKEELDRLIKEYPKCCKFLTHFGFDELDLKIKLKSIEKKKPEEEIRKEVSMLVDISEYIVTDRLKYIVEQNPNALKEAIDKTYEKLKKEPVKNENRKIGENLEKIIKEIVEREGLRAKPIYRGGDLEIWPKDYEGWDSGLIEIPPYLLEIKFTSGSRVHLSKTQSDYARNHRDKYVVLVVENVNNLREEIKSIDEDSISEELISRVIENSHIIENIYTKLGEMPDPDEVEPDINGYWVKKRLWEDKNDILKWLQKAFGDGV